MIPAAKVVVDLQDLSSLPQAPPFMGKWHQCALVPLALRLQSHLVILATLLVCPGCTAGAHVEERQRGLGQEQEKPWQPPHNVLDLNPWQTADLLGQVSRWRPLPHSRQFRHTPITCCFPQLPWGLGAARRGASSAAAPNPSSATRTLNLFCRWRPAGGAEYPPGTESHQFPAFALLRVFISHACMHRLCLLPPVQQEFRLLKPQHLWEADTSLTAIRRHD